MSKMHLSNGLRLMGIKVGVALALFGAPLADLSAADSGHADGDPLLEGFRTPPMHAHPQVWWHWMSGNVSLKGAKLDLAWMKRVGVGGVHTFSGGGLGEPSVVQPPVDFLSPAWQDIFRETTRIARESGMEVTIAGSPGWSETGGTWVAPRDAMKKYVWSETSLDGGKPFKGVLVAPAIANGPFLGVKATPRIAAQELLDPLYEDSRVVAFLTPPADTDVGVFTASCSAGAIDLAPLHANDLAEAVELPIAADEHSAWIQITYARPTTLAALTLGLRAVADVEIQASDDGQTFHRITAARADPSEKPSPQQTYAFAAIRARVFRVILGAPASKAPLPGLPSMYAVARPPARSFAITRLSFSGGARVNRFESKAGFQSTREPQDISTPDASSNAVIPIDGVMDLTGKLKSDGHLDWTPPRGHWTVLRFGWSLTGQTNGPAEPKDTGLEVDKLDAAQVRGYIEHYLALYQAALGKNAGAAQLQSLLTDSWEAGVQNWTPTLLAQFQARRGYDPGAYLPVLAGRVVRDAASSDRFLWDFYRTLKELLADNHYGVLATVLHEHGMQYYTESQGDTPRAIGDGMTIKARADIPTAEFWYRPFATAPGQPSLVADLQEAASAAHVYGKPLVANESLTVAAGSDPWSFSPAMMKPVADEIFGLGVNRILMHESHHQPLIDKAPGLEMGFFGQYFNRNDTWAEEAGAWVTYLSRTSYLLQQGRFVADVAFFFGEDRNLTERYLDEFNTDVPPGYGFDYINPEALLTLLSVKDGQVVTPSGMHYRVLYLPTYVTRLTLPALKKLRELVVDGAVLAAQKPLGGLGLASPDADVAAIADELWGSGSSHGAVRSLGRGRIYGTADLRAVLNAEHIAPDVEVRGARPGDTFMSVHRRTDNADIYFISNRQSSARQLQLTLRVSGKLPQLWHAESGRVEPLAYQMTPDGIRIALALNANEADFIVLRGAAALTAVTIPTPVNHTLTTWDGPWTVRFQEGRGAPPTLTLNRLIDLSTSSDSGVKYFSGEATYAKDIMLAKDWVSAGHRLMVNLGTVHELAVVSIDGQVIDTAWHAPFQVELPRSLKAGRHHLEIKVANLWVNRLVGDKQEGAAPIAFAPQSPYSANSPLRASGLMGPVQLESHEN
jgi:hypothetical protein